MFGQHGSLKEVDHVIRVLCSAAKSISTRRGRWKLERRKVSTASQCCFNYLRLLQSDLADSGSQPQSKHLPPLLHLDLNLSAHKVFGTPQAQRPPLPGDLTQFACHQAVPGEDRHIEEPEGGSWRNGKHVEVLCQSFQRPSQHRCASAFPRFLQREIPILSPFAGFLRPSKTPCLFLDVAIWVCAGPFIFEVNPLVGGNGIWTP
mmetsp:Transcript_52889/g.113370  ORF Transcript_52889/g.113370 Transcript_52889/m.113370 type:complete len:204 (+) Transcript_52889:247-858(+)